ncbi:SRP-independent targeting protein 3 [Nakaseomyces bracarensis]|uniref:SRP-independent targeting protein 3 n=1 Tax=Nakaseomyces bracarensis TaxID=273131 RepID=A0ABR4NY27_9SACH
MINSQVSNIIIMLVMMQVSRRIDMEDPTNILYIRIAYCTSMVLSFLIYQYARSKIVAKNDLTTMKYVEPTSPFSGEALEKNQKEKFNVTTVKDYDLKEIDGAIKSIYTGVMMMGFMHFYMGYVNPLFMQSISPIKSALEHNEVKIHVFNKPATGDLKRPFKAASLFGGFGQQPAAQEDKKSIEKAERAGNGGVGVKAE